MKIEFYLETGEVIENSDDIFFVMNDVVWRDNMRSMESQEACVSFDTFVEECPHIGWRVT